MPTDSKLTHFNERGEAHMVDVGGKPARMRKAVAEGWITMRADTWAMLGDGASKKGTHKKGDVLAVARVAGIMAAKRTAELVPLCHPLMLTHVSVEFSLISTPAVSTATVTLDQPDNAVHCIATTATLERTGVEMEALTAVQIALLTIYDMCKAMDRGMEICNVRLVHKSGGKSGQWDRPVGKT